GGARSVFFARLALAGSAAPIAGRRHEFHTRAHVEELRRDGSDIHFLGLFVTRRAFAARFAAGRETFAFPCLGGRGLLRGGGEDVQFGRSLAGDGNLSVNDRCGGNRGLGLRRFDGRGSGRLLRGLRRGRGKRVRVFAGGVDDFDRGGLVVGRSGAGGGGCGGARTLPAG